MHEDFLASVYCNASKSSLDINCASMHCLLPEVKLNDTHTHLSLHLHKKTESGGQIIGESNTYNKTEVVSVMCV